MPRACLLLLPLLLAVGCAGAVEGPYSSEDGAAAVALSEVASDGGGLAGEAAETAAPGPIEGRHPRKIIYTSRVDLVVEDLDPVPAKVADLAEQYGGYVADSNLYGQPGRPRHASWTIRVPVENYDKLLAQARSLGELRSLSTDSKDVSEEYYDVDARIRNKQKTETRLLELLAEAAGNLDQVLAVEEKLDRVREEIERMQGRLRVLSDQTSLATVTISVEEIRGYQAEVQPTYGTRVRRAFAGSIRALVTAATELSILLVALAPWLAVALVLLLVVGLPVSAAMKARRRRREAAAVAVAAEVVEPPGG